MNPRLVRRAGAVTLAAAAATALAGCGSSGIGAKLTFTDVAKVKVSRIVFDGGSGDVRVHTSPIGETRITRIVHSSSDPGASYTISGTELRLGTSCGHNCRVSYDIEAPTGVGVAGALSSGSVALDGVGAVDVSADSGDIAIRGATGAVRAQATSGDITISGSTGPATLAATSGDVRATDMTGGVDVTADSGDIDVKLNAPASVTAAASSGDVEVIVPAGSYQVRAHADSGDERVTGVTDDATARDVLDLRASSGDVTVAAAPAA
jgi:Putative adhesin